MDNLSKGNTTFALNLFKKLSENANTQNLFFSPLSISSALSMVFLCAKVNTAAQMAKVLSLDKETCIDSCRKCYHAELEQLDFSRAAEDSRKHIISWVEEKTEGKIQNLLAQGVVDSMTRLVLVNAIYFKGNWETQFNKDCTVEMQFKINK
ncbi:unnamed protein product [Lepidochelys olivacea]